MFRFLIVLLNLLFFLGFFFVCYPVAQASLIFPSAPLAFSWKCRILQACFPKHFNFLVIPSTSVFYVSFFVKAIRCSHCTHVLFPATFCRTTSVLLPVSSDSARKLSSIAHDIQVQHSFLFFN